MKTNIVRTKKGKEFPKEKFTCVSSTILKTPSTILSDGAFRVLVYLLSQRDDYVTYVEEVAVQLNKTEKTIKKHFDELIEKGYCVKEHVSYKKNNYTWFEHPGLNPSFEGEIPLETKLKEEVNNRKTIREEKKRKNSASKIYTHVDTVLPRIIADDDSNDYALNQNEMIELFSENGGNDRQDMPVMFTENADTDYRLMNTNFNEYFFNKDYNNKIDVDQFENIQFDDDLDLAWSWHKYHSENNEKAIQIDDALPQENNIIISKTGIIKEYNPTLILRQSVEWERLKREYSRIVDFDAVFKKCIELVNEDSEKGIFSDEVILVKRFEGLLKNKIILQAKDKNLQQIPSEGEIFNRKNSSSPSIPIKESNIKFISAWKNKPKEHQHVVNTTYAYLLKKINTNISVEEFSFVMDLLLENYSGDIIDKGIIKFVSKFGYTQVFVTGKILCHCMDEICYDSL